MGTEKRSVGQSKTTRPTIAKKAPTQRIRGMAWPRQTAQPNIMICNEQNKIKAPSPAPSVRYAQENPSI
jgi:hypothetical protein